MNEVELIYHYSKVELLCIDYSTVLESFHFKDVLECYELEIKLNGVTVARGDEYHDKIFDFKKGFLLACTKLLTFYSTKKTFIADLEY